MSVAAIPIYNALVEQGMPPERAQEAAEAAAEAQRKALEEVARKAEKFTDQKVAESEKTLRGEMAVAAERAAAQTERAAAQTEQVRRESVTREEFHQRTGELATRAEMQAEFTATRAEHHADMRALRAEIAALNRTMILGFIGTISIVVAVVTIAVSILLTNGNPSP